MLTCFKKNNGICKRNLWKDVFQFKLKDIFKKKIKKSIEKKTNPTLHCIHILAENMMGPLSYKTTWLESVTPSLSSCLVKTDMLGKGRDMVGRVCTPSHMSTKRADGMCSLKKNRKIEKHCKGPWLWSKFICFFFQITFAIDKNTNHFS